MTNKESPKVMIGKKKLTEKEKEFYRSMVNFTCEKCFRHENIVGKLQPHRFIRGHRGGTYCPRNVLVCCSSCHKSIHAGEFNKK